MENNEKRGDKMVRSFVVLLLFIIIFVAGILVGVDRKSAENQLEQRMSNNSFYMEKEMEAMQSTKEIEPYQEAITTNYPEESTRHFTQKAALFLETGVIGFYTIIIEIMYQIASIFI